MFHVKHHLHRLIQLAGRPLTAGRPPKRADAIVVLGCRLRPDGVPTIALAERLAAAADLYHQGFAPEIIVTGGRRWHGHREAHVMARSLVEAGVPDDAIIVEALSNTTYENARFTAQLLSERDIESLLLVTSPFHLRRALATFRLFSLQPRGVLVTESLQLQPGYELANLKAVGHEYAGLTYQLLDHVARKSRR